MIKLSQETIAIVTVGVALISGLGFNVTSTLSLRDEIQSVRAEIQSVRTEIQSVRAEARDDREVLRAEARADREALRAEARADREAFERHIIRLTQSLPPA